MATVTRFVDTASSGGDGTTQSHSGGTAAYASLSAWEAAEQTNLVTDGDVHVVNCAGTSDSTKCLITGWTTGASNGITVQGDATAPDSDGVNGGDAFSTSHYHMVLATTETNALEINENFVDVLELQFEHAGTSTFDETLEFSSVGSGATLNVRKCRFRATGTTENSDAININDSSGVTVTVENCTIDWQNASNCRAIEVAAGNGTVDIDNCTISGADSGIRVAATTTINVTNCAIFNNTDDFTDASGALATITIDFCATDDGDGTNSIDISPGGTEADDWNDAFTDYVNGDFTVKNTSSVLYNAGTNTGAPSDDILGTSRPQATTTDVGAFELVAAAGSVGSVSGLATAAAVGASTHSTAGASFGVAGSSIIGRSLNAAEFSSAGLAAALAVGRASKKGVASSDGAATAAAIGQSDHAADAAADGVATAAAEGQLTHQATAAGAGVATAAAVGASRNEAVADASGTAEAIATSVTTISGDALSEGSATAEAVGQAGGAVTAKNWIKKPGTLNMS